MTSGDFVIDSSFFGLISVIMTYSNQLSRVELHFS